MKLSKRHFVYISLFGVLLSCQQDDSLPYPDWNKHVGAATKVALNPTRNSYRLANGIANEFIEFTLNVDGYELTEISEVELQFTFLEASPARTVGPILLKKVNSFPSTVQVTSLEAATAIGGGFTPANFQNGDRLRLTFPILTSDGRKLTVALNSELCTNPAQPLFGHCQVLWNVVN